MPYGAVLNVAILVAFILAFIKAEELKAKVVLASIMAALIILPKVVTMTATSWIWWVHYVAKVIFGLGCVIYIKWQGMAY